MDQKNLNGKWLVSVGLFVNFERRMCLVYVVCPDIFIYAECNVTKNNIFYLSALNRTKS